MPDDYKKDLIGFEDMFIDDRGIGQQFSRKLSTGGTHLISGMNAQLIPILLATRTLEMYDAQILNADEVDGALTSICASLATIKRFENEDVLQDIQSAGSGTVISVLERQKLNEITSLGSGQIITDPERNKLNSLIGLTQEQIDAILDIETITPVASISLWTKDVAPLNYLECDGLAVSRETFSDLFGVIGIDYGSGNGTTTFNLPDLRGRFPRGWDHGAGRDPDTLTRTDRGDGTTGDNVGTLQEDEFGTHDHDVTVNVKDNVGAIGDVVIGGAGNRSPNPTYTSTEEGGEETRPVNIYMMYIIRFAV